MTYPVSAGLSNVLSRWESCIARGLFLVLLLVLLPRAVGAQEVPEPPGSGPACRQTVEEELAKEERLYRSVLFGHRSAKDAPVGEVRFDSVGTPWIKSEEDTWETPKHGEESPDAKSDDDMDGADLLEVRRGIFETKRVLTSELLPSLTQSFRALGCRVDLLCATVDASLKRGEEEAQDVTVSAPGCMNLKTQTFTSCHVSAIPEEGDALAYCRSIGGQMVEREKGLLKMSVEYDAAYRSFLQLSGSFDLLLQDIRWPVMNTLRKAAGIIGVLNRIPCFLSSCDQSPPAP